MTIRRHSFSAPARFSLSLITDCLDRVNNLSGRVTRLASRTKEERLEQVREKILLGIFEPGQKHRSRSIGDLRFPDLSGVVLVEELLDEILTMALEQTPNDKPKAKIRVCHQCHAPTDDQVHVGVPCGVGRCPLDHWHGCKGGIEGGKGENGKVWAACTEAVTTDDSDPGTESEDDPAKKKLVNELPATVSEAAAILEAGLIELDSDSSSEDEELRQQREELDKLQREVDKTSLEARR